MSRRLLPLGALVLLGAPAELVSAPAPERTHVRFAGGDCDALVMSGARISGCRPRLVTMLYHSGLVSFAFSGPDGRLLSFLGRVERQVGDQTSLQISQVTFVPRGGSRAFANPVKGSCVLAAFAANRSRLECSARAGRTRYSAMFRTADETPVFVTL
jgi:hypothetical protein